MVDRDTLAGDFLIPAAQILKRYGISEMTLWRWLRDNELGFPRPIVINRRRYWWNTGVSAWERSRPANAVVATAPQ
jgi:predicted DNA-binding transcriptional regulator AlpA